MGEITVVRYAEAYLTRLCTCAHQLDLKKLEEIVLLFTKAQQHGATIFLAGNGGSAATASHMANDLAKTVLGHNSVEPGAYRAIALTDNVPLITAWANDNHFDHAFSGQLIMLGRIGDILVLISGSGNSRNLLQAADMAHHLGMKVVSILGKGGGLLLEKSDLVLLVPSDEYGIIEDMHMIINHLIATYIIARGGVGLQTGQSSSARKRCE